MSRKEQIEQEMVELIHELEPAEPEKPKPEKSKNKLNPSQLLLFILAGMMIATLTVTFVPDKKPVIVYQINDTPSYPINQTGTEFTVRSFDAGEEFPNIRIGPGCSMTRRTKAKSKDSINRI